MNPKQNAAKADEEMQWERFNEITTNRRSHDSLRQFTRTALNESDIQRIITLDSDIQALKDRIKNIELGIHHAEMKYKQTGNMQRLCVANALTSKVLDEKSKLAKFERERENIVSKTRNQQKLLETALRMTMPDIFDSIPSAGAPVKNKENRMTGNVALKRKQLGTYRLACDTIEDHTVDSDTKIDKEFSSRCSELRGSQESLNKSMRVIDEDDSSEVEYETRPESGCSGGSDWRGSMDALNKTMRSIVLEDSDSE